MYNVMERLQGYSYGPVRPSADAISACRRGYDDYNMQGDAGCKSSRCRPQHYWHYMTGATAAKQKIGLARALHTLTLAHVPGASYSRWDGFRSPNPAIHINPC
ncbi:MAG: hypothetical protein ACYDB1_01155 [Acidiferrobacteraceae bacterium]